jgi:hypothetical protein
MRGVVARGWRKSHNEFHTSSYTVYEIILGQLNQRWWAGWGK